MPLQATSGAASYDAFGGGVPSEPNYIESVFSCFLYTGNGSTQTITNGIDLSTNGGLVWYKDRTTAYEHQWVDTARGAGYNLESPNTTASTSRPTALTAFNTTGFTLGSNAAANGSGDTFASWTFRKQPKFFDVLTWTGNGVQGRQISHALGSTPGCIIVKCTSTASNWTVYHRSLTTNYILQLNSTTSAINVGSPNAYVSAPTDTTFTVGNDSDVNANGATYVAYLFAHDAGGFGLTGTDNVISCGSYTGNGSTTNGPLINLGYEPQWLLIKNASDVYDWFLYDTMRGLTADLSTSSNPVLYPNLSVAEASYADVAINSTGFKIKNAAANPRINASGNTYIYIAIRRGPMKVPTSGTSVFSVDYQGQYTPKPPGHTSGFVTDMALVRNKNTTNDMINVSRLTGDNYLITSSTAAAGALSFIDFDYMNGWGDLSTTDANYYSWMWRRAPSFFDVVCYTGGGSTTYIYNHNLSVVPELIIIKSRSNGTNVNYWPVKAKSILGQKALALNNATENPISSTYWPSTNDTATQFRVVASNSAYDSNATGYTYVAYLFATCAGVSKVGSYTGTGTTLQVDCGFTGGARFVLIKKTSGSGSWYVWDSARGIVSGNDPYLLLNTTAAEVTSTDYIDTYSAGFEISSTAPSAINESGGSFIFLAIA